MSQLENAAKAAEQLNQALSQSEQMIKSFQSAASKSTDSFKNLTGSAQLLGESLRSTLGMLGTMSGMAGMDKLGQILTDAGGAAKLFGDLFGVASNAIQRGLGNVDAFTQSNRDLDKTMYGVASQFGKTFDAAQRYSDLYRQIQGMSSISLGFVSTEEMESAIKTFGATTIGLDAMTKSVQFGSNSMSLFELSLVHAKGIGLETSQYIRYLDEAMNRQGLSAQDAAEQMAMFGKVAQDTGVKTSDVAQSLNSVANSFSKLGMTADFGKPIFKDFAETLSGMGLGLNNTAELSTTLSNSLAKLTTDYANAYYVFQRGGLDFGGGGGALGASISLQAKMLEAEKTGDQASVARELLGGMKDTLASFAGGEIVTVQEANRSPEKQMGFYTQSSLLQQQFQMDAQSASRTLDLLDQLNKATMSGDDDMVKELESQFSESLKSSDSTKGEMEKLNVTTSAQLAQLLVSGRHLEAMAVKFASEEIRMPVSGIVGEFSDIMDKAIGGAGGETPRLDEVKSMISSFAGSANERMKSITNKISGEPSSSAAGQAPFVEDVSSTVAGAANSVSGYVQSVRIEVSDDFKKYFSFLQDLYEERTNGMVPNKG